MSYYQINPGNSIFEDRRIELDRRALLNFNKIHNNDRRAHRDRRSWRKQFHNHDGWWLQVNYVDKDYYLGSHVARVAKSPLALVSLVD